jgi:4a-hydroxytetrahydrobiopterin dehydratase
MTDTSLEAQIDELNGWTHEGNMIRKTLKFKDFAEAIGWTVRVAFLAEAHGHHPDIDIRYNRVTLALTTHDAGNQVTQKDVDLARAVEEIAG